ncbi:hypothetical protein BD779DRAFT_290666 [Infundibulicybe gibba]|nr:hypothetical protein BD779DRAFT_290666 [Infundibulicybe gibba]
MLNTRTKNRTPLFSASQFGGPSQIPNMGSRQFPLDRMRDLSPDLPARVPLSNRKCLALPSKCNNTLNHSIICTRAAARHNVDDLKVAFATHISAGHPTHCPRFRHPRCLFSATKTSLQSWKLLHQAIAIKLEAIRGWRLLLPGYISLLIPHQVLRSAWLACADPKLPGTKRMVGSGARALVLHVEGVLISLHHFPNLLVSGSIR